MINSTQTSVEFGIDGEFEQLTHDSAAQIANRINRIRMDHNPCFQVRISSPQIDLGLSTPSCAIRGGSRRQLGREEAEIFELWKSKNLNNDAYPADGAASFVKEMIRRFL